MVRPHFLSALAASALAAPALAASEADAAAATGVRAKLLPGQRIVAFSITDSANVIDLAGAWEVFQDTPLPGHDNETAFLLYLVGPAARAVEATGGMQLMPRYTYANAPRPDIVVVGAQAGAPELVPWLQKQAQTAEVVMSVCTGAFKLAKAGLFDGKSATTHHDFYDAFEKQFPKVRLVRGQRFVDEGRVVSAGGLTSGIDLALHLVERMHGRPHADAVASYMEFVRTARPVAAERLA
ncbi:MAG TPA: DJ-1/PfpI family protein [Candidatus Elarobacter sp.]